MGREVRQLTTSGWLLMAMVFLAPAVARAQTQAPIGASFNVPTRVKLTVPATSLTFPNSDPDTVSLISANEGTVDITASATNTGTNQILLTVQAGGNLLSGGNSIDISNLKWNGGGPGFAQIGTMSTSAQTMASWSASGTYTGQILFQLVNSWSYAVGTYATTLTFTLATP